MLRIFLHLCLFLLIHPCLSLIKTTPKPPKHQEPDCCTKIPTIVSVFNEEFYKRVVASPVLSALSDLGNLTAEDFQDIALRITASELKILGSNSTDDTETPEIASESIVVDNFSGTQMLQVFANTASQYMYQTKKLNTGNAVSMAQMYSRVIEEACDNLQMWLSNPYLKTLSFCYGIIGVFQRLGVFEASNVREIAVLFANQWKCLDRMS